MISIIVLTYNGLDTVTKPCLESIVRNTTIGMYELIVVDNASNDDTPQFLRNFSEAHPQVRIKLNSLNKGYASGNNDGILLAKGNFVVLLNNDTLVPHNWLEKLISVFDRDPKIGMVGPISNSVGNEQKVNIPGLTRDNFDEISTAYCSRHHNIVQYVEKIGFFCVAIKREALDAVGVLDDRFGIGMFEDDDYCLRIRQAGYEIVFAEYCFVYHSGSFSFKKFEHEEYNYLFKKNRELLQKKHNIVWLYSQLLSSYTSFFKSNIDAYKENKDLQHLALERILVRIDDMHIAKLFVKNDEKLFLESQQFALLNHQIIDQCSIQINKNIKEQETDLNIFFSDKESISSLMHHISNEIIEDNARFKIRNSQLAQQNIQANLELEEKDHQLLEKDHQLLEKDHQLLEKDHQLIDMSDWAYGMKQRLDTIESFFWLNKILKARELFRQGFSVFAKVIVNKIRSFLIP